VQKGREGDRREGGEGGRAECTRNALRGTTERHQEALHNIVDMDNILGENQDVDEGSNFSKHEDLHGASKGDFE